MSRTRFVVPVLALAAVWLAACGSDGSGEPDTGIGRTQIGAALETAGGSEVTVSGFLIVVSDRNARLCSTLLESDPPQCGDDRIDLLGFDVGTVPNTSTPQRPSEIATTMWTNSPITVTGTKAFAGLIDVRLSSAD